MPMCTGGLKWRGGELGGTDIRTRRLREDGEEQQCCQSFAQWKQTNSDWLLGHGWVGTWKSLEVCHGVDWRSRLGGGMAVGAIMRDGRECVNLQMEVELGMK